MQHPEDLPPLEPPLPPLGPMTRGRKRAMEQKVGELQGREIKTKNRRTTEPELFRKRRPQNAPDQEAAVSPSLKRAKKEPDQKLPSQKLPTQKLSSQELPKEVLRIIELIPERQRPLAHAAILCLARKGTDHAAVLDALGRIDPEERASVLLALFPLFQDNAYGFGIDSLLAEVCRIAPEERVAVIAAATFELQRVQPVYRELYLRSVRGVPVSQVPQALNAVLSALEGITSLSERDEILYTIQEVSPEKRGQVLAEAKPRLLEVDDGMKRASIIRKVAQGARQYVIHLEHKSLLKQPIVLLDRLAGLIDEGPKRELRIRANFAEGKTEEFQNQFIGDLFKRVLRVLQGEPNPENGLYRPKLRFANNQFVFPDEEKRAYQNLGKLMLFCLNSENRDPVIGRTETAISIGLLFDEGMFYALKELSDEDVERDFDALLADPTAFNRLYSVFKALNVTETQMIRQMDEAVQDASFDKKDFTETILRPALAPLFEIAKGMKRAPFLTPLSWQALRKLDPRELSSRLQGAISREELVKEMDFDERIPETKREWLREWIRTTDSDKLLHFLCVLTGSSMGGSIPISIVDNSALKNPPIYFHRCGKILDVPFRKIATKEDFLTSFEVSLADQPAP